MAGLWDNLVQGYVDGDSWRDDPMAAPEAPSVTKAPTADVKNPWDSFINQAMPTDHSGGREVVTYDRVVQGLMDRGMPQHIAEGFAMNFQDESGFDTGINERNPLVEGSRGGFGLYQTTGSRRVQHEAFAKERGTTASDFDTTLDFLMWELENTEKRARDAIWSSSTAGEAGAAIVNKFLRPHESHRAKRASKYLGSGGTTTTSPTSTKLWLDF